MLNVVPWWQRIRILIWPLWHPSLLFRLSPLSSPSSLSLPSFVWAQRRTFRQYWSKRKELHVLLVSWLLDVKVSVCILDHHHRNKRGIWIEEVLLMSFYHCWCLFFVLIMFQATGSLEWVSCAFFIRILKKVIHWEKFVDWEKIHWLRKSLGSVNVVSENFQIRRWSWRQ